MVQARRWLGKGLVEWFGFVKAEPSDGSEHPGEVVVEVTGLNGREENQPVDTTSRVAQSETKDDLRIHLGGSTTFSKSYRELRQRPGGQAARQDAYRTAGAVLKAVLQPVQ